MIIYYFKLLYIIMLFDIISNIIINILFIYNINDPFLYCILCKNYIELYTEHRVYIKKGFIIYDNKFAIHFWLETNSNIIDYNIKLLQLFNNKIKNYKITYDLPIGENINSSYDELFYNNNYIKYLKKEIWLNIETIYKNINILNIIKQAEIEINNIYTNK